MNAPWHFGPMGLVAVAADLAFRARKVIAAVGGEHGFDPRPQTRPSCARWPRSR